MHELKASGAGPPGLGAAAGSLRGATAARPALVSPRLCDPNVTQHAGYLEAAPGVEYFFWLFESRADPKADPLVLWLSGGPGCSSQLALLVENGPCKVIREGQDTELNPYSWTSHANVIWLDQPAATGFSTGEAGDNNTEAEVARRLYAFLQNFYRALPQYRGNDLYIFGESYAGHYVPAVGHYLWQQGKRTTSLGTANEVRIPLRGLGIGNGMTNPEVQFQSYEQMLRDGGRSEGGSLQEEYVPVLSYYELARMHGKQKECTAMISQCQTMSEGGDTCMDAYVFCIMNFVVPFKETGINQYDMRKQCEVQDLCYNFTYEEVFLNLPSTQEQLGVKRHWEECNMEVVVGFMGEDWMKNYQMLLPELLADGVQVLIYAGDVDYICNWLGNKRWTLDLEWPHKADFNAAEDRPFVVDGTDAGRVRSSAGLHFVQVYQAGHLAPMDKPKALQQMLEAFLARGLDPSGGSGRDEVLLP